MDSGAQISCINENFLKSTKFNSFPRHPSSLQGIIGAGGVTHKVVGQIEIPVNLNGQIIHQTFQIIPALRNLLILGMDFFVTNEASINIGNKKLKVHVYVSGKKIAIPLIKKDVGCIRSLSSINIPPNSARNIPVKITSSHKTDILVRPLNYLSKMGIQIPSRCILGNRNNRSVIKIINPTNITKTIRANSIIGKSSSINELEISQYVNNITSDIDSDKKAPIKFDLSKSQLNKDQKQKLQFFLESNRDVFAFDLSELGHATLLQHEIILQDSIPVQSRPYRVSPKMKLRN